MHTVVIIDDHDIVRYGIEMLVNGAGDLQAVASAHNLEEGLRQVALHAPDLVVTDMGTGDSQGLDTVRRVVAAQAPRATVVVSMQDEMLYAERVIGLGALGYVMKDTAHAALLPAARSALQGQAWVSPRVAALLVRRTMRHAPPADEPERLTPREMDVLEQLKAGRSTKEIARLLDLSVRTVDLHRANLKRKLGLRSGAELIAFASRRL